MAEVTEGREQSVDPSLEEARNQLARMIALHGYDSSLVEDDIFRRFVGILNPRFTVPSRGAIEEMCDGIADDARRDLAFIRLKSLNYRMISLSVGRAKTMEKQVLYVMEHHIDDEWNLLWFITYALLESHQPGAGTILGVHEFRVHVARVVFSPYYPDADKVSMVAMDNGIQPMLEEYIGEVRSREIHLTTFVDHVLHSIARCLIPHSCFLFLLSDDLNCLELTRQERQQLLSHLGPDYQWAYDEYWYLCYCSLEVIQNKGSSRFCCPLKELLSKLWGRIYRAIKAISVPSCPTSNLCLAELFKVRDILQSELDHADIYAESERHFQFEDGKDMAHLLREALETLDKSIQDSYLTWSIPLVMDPRYKLRYIKFNFERAYGSKAEKHISQVMTMLKKVYSKCVDPESSDIAMAASDDPLEQAWNEYRCSQDDGIATKDEAELVRYLEDPLSPQTQGFDVLRWWKIHSLVYPKVARMARFALAMPTSSKLSSEQMAYVKSKIRGYSKRGYQDDEDI